MAMLLPHLGNAGPSRTHLVVWVYHQTEQPHISTTTIATDVIFVPLERGLQDEYFCAFKQIIWSSIDLLIVQTFSTLYALYINQFFMVLDVLRLVRKV